ncbi:MAG TPA: hypothetical protein VGF82_04645 [Terracidiphilus sp.]
MQSQIDRGKSTKLADAIGRTVATLRLRIQASHAARFRTAYYAQGDSWTEFGSIVDVSSLPPRDRRLRAALFAGRGEQTRIHGFALRYGSSR